MHLKLILNNIELNFNWKTFFWISHRKAQAQMPSLVNGTECLKNEPNPAQTSKTQDRREHFPLQLQENNAENFKNSPQD